MKVLLTGGSGMVGRNIIDKSKEFFDVEMLAPRRAELDLMNESAVAEYVTSEKPDVVIHAAGTVGGIQANIAAPVRFLTDNLTLGTNVIMGARAAGVKQLINIGSSCMYPAHAQNPLRESIILNGAFEPTNEGYALAKVACARLCQYINTEDVEYKYKTIIPCNLYGRYDKFDPQNSHMIPAVIRKIYEAKTAGNMNVDIWGDGKARREFMYAGDLADFIFFALSKFDDLPQDLNVGLGHDYSINDYYKEVANVVGYTGQFEHDLTKPTGMAQKLVDINLATVLGWQANTTLNDGITKTLDYFINEVL